MPTFQVDPSGRRNPKRLTQRAPERRIQDLLLHNPRLLGHPSDVKPRRIIWFWHHSKGPGDLWGIDDRGHLVIVELKKRLGSRDESKAASQIRRAARLGQRWKRKVIAEKYRWMKSQYGLRGGGDFAREFHQRTGRSLHLKLSDPYLYIVAGHYTNKGARAVRRRGRRRLREIRFVMMYEIQVPGRRGACVVATERL